MPNCLKLIKRGENFVQMTASISETTDTVTLRGQALHKLREAIIGGGYHAGDKLVERELCTLTGASRSVLREALAELGARGLIEHQSYCGYRVAQMTARQVREVFELRSSLETLAAELFTERASEAETSALRQAQAELDDALSQGGLAKMRAAKERYYDVLFSGCRNGEIQRALEVVIDRVYFLRSQLLMDPDRRIDSQAEMQRLTDALCERDRLAARTASLAHLEAARDALLQRLAETNSSPLFEDSRRGAGA